MRRQAILQLLRSSASNVQVDDYKAECEELARRKGFDVKAFKIDLDNPPEVTFYLGRMVRFASGALKPEDLSENNGDTPEEQTFKQWFRHTALPEFGKMMREVWKPSPREGDKKPAPA